MLVRFHPAFLAWLLFFVPTTARLVAEPREWTSTDGRTLLADFVSATSQTVTVRRADGRRVDIPLAQLSDADRAWIAAGAPAAPEAPAASAPQSREKLLAGPLTYKLSDGSEKWPEERRKRIVDAMDEAVIFLNTHARFEKSVTANNSPGTPTADANWDGWINWGGSIGRRVALHEIAHTLGVGTHPNWRKNIRDGVWTGPHAIRQLREFDGPDAKLHADRMHFWPYGLNFDNESSPENDLRFVKIVAALRKDMGID
jgi:hypothetical protein